MRLIARQIGRLGRDFVCMYVCLSVCLCVCVSFAREADGKANRKAQA